MNPLFYDLSQKAEDITDQLYSRKLSGESWQDIFRQKYGELIVSKCIEMIEPDREHRRDAKWGYKGGEEGVELLDVCVRAIKEHFGMEKEK